MRFIIFGIQLTISRAEPPDHAQSIERALQIHSLESELERTRSAGLSLYTLGGPTKTW